jgi:hypothetical protein
MYVSVSASGVWPANDNPALDPRGVMITEPEAAHFVRQPLSSEAGAWLLDVLQQRCASLARAAARAGHTLSVATAARANETTKPVSRTGRRILASVSTSFAECLPLYYRSRGAKARLQRRGALRPRSVGKKKP